MDVKNLSNESLTQEDLTETLEEVASVIKLVGKKCK